MSLSLSFNLPSVLEYDSIRYFHAVTFECSSILSHEHTLRSKVHCDLVLVLSLPQFWRSVPDRDTDPPLALSLTTLHTSYCKILHKKFFFTTLHTSYCKHCTRRYFHNFEHILLQNIAQDIVYNFARMLSQNIVQEISPAIETLVQKRDFRLIIEILHSTKFCAPKFRSNSPSKFCKKINFLTFFLQLDEQAEAIELANSVLIEVRLFGFLTFSQLQCIPIFFCFLQLQFLLCRFQKLR